MRPMTSALHTTPRSQAPLAGLKVIEMGQLIAGPFAAKTLADFGAEVIKIEPTGSGDPLRKWRLLKNGTSVWWQVQSRNKQSVALDLKQAPAQDIVRRLAAEADVLIENFRPGTLEAWGLSPESLLEANPRLVVLRVSGYGQTGPYRDRPGFGVVGEAMGGIRHLTAEPGRVPVRVGVSLGDTLAALHGVIGILLALQERHRSGQGQVIDVALYEAVFNCMESLLPEFSAFGEVRGPAGSALPGIAPSNAYPCQDGGYVLIAGNGDSIFKRLMHTMGRDDLGLDADLADNTGRVRRVAEIDAAIAQWTRQHPIDHVLAELDKAAVPAGRIYTVADIASDPHYLARGMVQSMRMDDGEDLLVPGVVPKLSRTPGGQWRNAPSVGQDTDAVLQGMGLTAGQIQQLRDQGIVA
ncbi:MAG: Succinyl-CoA:(R)-benzylsuccinate CoA-transferase subunit BbsF [Pseudomonadota bacterium]